jgi:hypothetical protein
MLPAGVKKKLGDALYFISFVFNKECVREHFMSRIACIDAPGALHHINPIRTGQVADVALLDRYPFADIQLFWVKRKGHGEMMQMC